MNGLFKTPTGVYAVRDNVAYGIPNDTEGARVFGANFFQNATPVGASDIAGLTPGNWYDVFPAGMPYIAGVPVLLLVLVAVLLFLAKG